jgi:hypothetical protein
MTAIVRRIGITLISGVIFGVLLTILAHASIGHVAPQWHRDGQYVFLFFFLIVVSASIGSLGSILLLRPTERVVHELPAIVVGWLASIVLTFLVLWVGILVDVHFLSW